MRAQTALEPVSEVTTRFSIQGLSDDVLKERIQDLSFNTYMRNDRNAIWRDAVAPLQEHLAEVDRRGIDVSLDSHLDAQKPDPIVLHNKLVRYGKKADLKKLLSGIVSLSPSAIYAQAQTRAQKDDEMVRLSFRNPSGPVDISGSIYKVLGWKEGIGLPKEQIYHMLCFSMLENAVIGERFAADSYIKVHDVEKFTRLASRAIAKKYPEAICLYSPVRYYDDFTPPCFESPSSFYFLKPISFMYQREYRFVVHLEGHGPSRLDVEVRWPKGLLELLPLRPI